MKRRTILLGILSILSAILGILHFPRFNSKSKDTPLMTSLDLQNVLTNNLPGLIIPEEEVEKFLKSYNKYYFTLSKGYIHSSSFVQDISKEYLMSSDFFKNGENVKKPLRFVSLSDPYISPCMNMQYRNLS